MASKISQLVKRVHEQTLAGKVGWEETEREDVYQASFPNYSIRYSSQPHRGTSQLDYVLTIYNQAGSVIEEVVDTELKESEIGYNAYNVMKETYETARGQALGVEQAIDDILGYLEDK